MIVGGGHLSGARRSRRVLPLSESSPSVSIGDPALIALEHAWRWYGMPGLHGRCRVVARAACDAPSRDSRGARRELLRGSRAAARVGSRSARQRFGREPPRRARRRRMRRAARAHRPARPTDVQPSAAWRPSPRNRERARSTIIICCYRCAEAWRSEPTARTSFRPRSSCRMAASMLLAEMIVCEAVVGVSRHLAITAISTRPGYRPETPGLASTASSRTRAVHRLPRTRDRPAWLLSRARRQGPSEAVRSGIALCR